MNNQPHLSKNSLRELINLERSMLTTDEQQTLSEKICLQLMNLEQIKQSQTIALYFSFRNEVDVTRLMHTTSQTLTFVFPVVLPNKQLEFHSHSLGDTTTLNQYKIEEPTLKQNAVALSQIDTMIIPALGFDTECNRLGTGAGYYDRTLATLPADDRPFLVIAAFDFQKTENIPTDSWDIPANCVVTEKKIYWRKK